VPPGEEEDPEQAGPSLDLDAVEEADGEQRGIHRDAVHPRRHVGQPVEVVLGRGGPPGLIIHRLRAADEAATPEEDAGDLGEEIADRRGVAPLDGIAGEHRPGERRPGPGRLQQRQDRGAHPDLPLGLEEARGVIHRVLGQGVRSQGVVQNLGG
jgi:hypothetical protein